MDTPRLPIGLMISTRQAYGRGILRGVLRYASGRPHWELEHAGDPGIRSLDHLCDRIGVRAIIGEARDGALIAACEQRVEHMVLVASGRREDAPEHFGRVTTANGEVGRMAFRFFRERGFTSLAYCGYATVFSEARLAAFAAAARTEGLAVTAHDLRESGMHRPRLNAWLENLPPLTGIFCASDPAGVAVLRAAKDIHRLVPDDLAVLGVDDDRLTCDLTQPALSSIDLGTEEIGFRAAETLDGHLQRKRQPRFLEISPRGVVERRSTEVIATEDPRLRRALQIIKERACDGLPVETVRAAAFMSRRSLETKFRAAFGLTVREQIERVRLNRARALLRETNLLTPDIAAECGWTSASRMSEAFRRETGQTPTAYRRSHRLA